jgi:hypothetical protein
MGDEATAREATDGADRTTAAMEQRYWLPDRGFYAYATRRPTSRPAEAEPGPHLERRQARLDELAPAALFDEDTVLPSVPMWWGQLDAGRADAQLDRVGSGHLATGWGTRILSDESRLYDPLSYHYGSVWPLFTGWASMAAYRYGRPHVGYQALSATAFLTWQGALGFVTELLSGDYNTAFGRSSHHQIWSEAMLVTPLVRGLLGLEIQDGGRVLRMAPQLPPTWDRVTMNRVPFGRGRDVQIVRRQGLLRIDVGEEGAVAEGSAVPEPGGLLSLAPAFPLDARVVRVSVNGRRAPFRLETRGDVQFAEVSTAIGSGAAVIDFVFDEGSEVWATAVAPDVGATNDGIRLLRTRARAGGIAILLEARGGRSATLGLRTPFTPQAPPDVQVRPTGNRQFEITLRFEGPDDAWVRREVDLPLRR